MTNQLKNDKASMQRFLKQKLTIQSVETYYIIIE
jgi:hypothetical protein